jgi:hypothetical protein
MVSTFTTIHCSLPFSYSFSVFGVESKSNFHTLFIYVELLEEEKENIRF